LRFDGGGAGRWAQSAEQIRAVLLSGEVRNAVNAPSIDAKTWPH
jgi:hypothetical protein